MKITNSFKDARIEAVIDCQFTYCVAMPSIKIPAKKIDINKSVISRGTYNVRVKKNWHPQ
jgi:hypothetical protein